MEIILTMMSLFVVWFIGALYGWHAHERMIEKNLRHAIHEFQEHINETHIRIKIEKHDDMLYVYDNTTHVFMAQGKDRYEIEKQLQDKFPGKRFAAEPNEIALLGAD